MNSKNIVNYHNFILAARDSGYKNTASAISELIDNSIEARATQINIEISKNKNNEFEIVVSDNGKGMNSEEISLALQFGGSTRFDSRHKLGRYGMGLPNSSISQCKRVEVYTWQGRNNLLYSYIDIDEIIVNSRSNQVRQYNIKEFEMPILSKSGTIVKWCKCDRLENKNTSQILKQLHDELGRIFRYYIWKGINILINGKSILPFDPLFIQRGSNLKGAKFWGKELAYQVRIPGKKNLMSDIRIRFSVLPIKKWSQLNNESKKRMYITQRAGVSVLRCGREIDYGWYFFGTKRKENYDEWWRCELLFEPELDEYFGVTHSKQGINQTEFINNVLVNDMESIARTLNNNVKSQFFNIKKSHPKVFSKTTLERNDAYLDGLKYSKNNFKSINSHDKIGGLSYEINLIDSNNENFFEIKKKQNKLHLLVNRKHIFYRKIFLTFHKDEAKDKLILIKLLEMLIFSAARSEFSFRKKEEIRIISAFKKQWSSNLNTFMS